MCLTCVWCLVYLRVVPVLQLQNRWCLTLLRLDPRRSVNHNWVFGLELLLLACGIFMICRQVKADVTESGELDFLGFLHGLGGVKVSQNCKKCREIGVARWKNIMLVGSPLLNHANKSLRQSHLSVEQVGHVDVQKDSRCST